MPLQIDLHHDDVSWSDETQETFKRAVRRLRDRLSRFNLRADRLEARFEPQGDQVRARLELALPGDAQTALAVEGSTPQALRVAFRGLFRRFDAYAWSIDHGTWRPLTSAVHPDRDEQLQRYRADLMRYALPALHRVAAHEIDRIQNEGELLAPDWLDPAEVVDSAIADRLPSLDPSLSLPDATLELVRAVREDLMARIAEIHEHQGEDISLEEPMGPSLILTDEEEGELPLEVLDLNLADVLSDPESLAPEDIVAEQERRDQLTQALFRLPDPYRPLFAQVVVDGWAQDVVAAAWQLPVEEIRRAVTEASRRLASILGDVEPDQIVAVYRAMGEQLAEERKVLEPVGAR